MPIGHQCRSSSSSCTDWDNYVCHVLYANIFFKDYVCPDASKTTSCELRLFLLSVYVLLEDLPCLSASAILIPGSISASPSVNVATEVSSLLSSLIPARAVRRLTRRMPAQRAGLQSVPMALGPNMPLLRPQHPKQLQALVRRQQWCSFLRSTSRCCRNSMSVGDSNF